MRKWLEAQWREIKGNVKYALLLLALGAIVTGAAVLVKDLPLWKEIVLIFLFVVLFAWAVIATWATRFQKRVTIPATPPTSPPASTQSPSKLVIHSADWAPIHGNPSTKLAKTDRTAELQTLPRDGLLIDANTLGDPTPGHVKHLLIEYSYGNDERMWIERGEGDVAVLPEDPFLRVFCFPQLQAFRLAKTLRDYLKEMGPVPKEPARQLQQQDPMSDAIDWMQRDLFPWRQRVKDGFERRFQDQGHPQYHVRMMALTFREKGKSNQILNNFIDNGLAWEPEKQILELSKALIAVAHELDD